MAKKYDPLWEIIDEKVALQDQEPDVDLPCPYCHVLLHVGEALSEGRTVTCGLCGGASQLVKTREGLSLRAPAEEK